MKNETKLPLTEELDFHYLLTLLPPLRGLEGFEWLPELFAIIGFDRLIELSKYAGGEMIRIPTFEELEETLNALQCFYDAYIAKRIELSEIPTNLAGLVRKIRDAYVTDLATSTDEGISGFR